jgi:hypothetical protein
MVYYSRAKDSSLHNQIPFLKTFLEKRPQGLFFCLNNNKKEERNKEKKKSGSAASARSVY